jgi:hypothetical protein
VFPGEVPYGSIGPAGRFCLLWNACGRRPIGRIHRRGSPYGRRRQAGASPPPSDRLPASLSMPYPARPATLRGPTPNRETGPLLDRDQQSAPWTSPAHHVRHVVDRIESVATAPTGRGTLDSRAGPHWSGAAFSSQDPERNGQPTTARKRSRAGVRVRIAGASEDTQKALKGCRTALAEDGKAGGSDASGTATRRIC